MNYMPGQTRRRTLRLQSKAPALFMIDAYLFRDHGRCGLSPQNMGVS